MTKKTSIVSIIPLLIFVAIFLGSGIYFDNFYSLPAPIIALFAVVVALLIYRAPLVYREKWTHPVKKLGLRPLLRYFTNRYYAVVAERINK